MLDKLEEWFSADKRVDDDLYDRLNHRYSTALFIAAALLTGGRQLMSERIRCWCPTEFTYHQTFFINDYCYVANTYYVPIADQLPGPSEVAGRRMINYYQWVTVCLLAQSLLFLIPKLVWRFVSNSRGHYISGVIRQLHSISKSSGMTEERKLMLDALVIYTDRFLEMNNHHGDSRLCCYLSRQRIQGYLLDVAYLIIKLLYLCNSIGQLYLINRFLGESGYHLWGLEMVQTLVVSGVVYLSDVFPIRTICDVDLRGMGGHVRRYTIQCVLPINVFHDRLYLAIWFWLVGVSVFTLVGILHWLTRYLCSKSLCVKRYLVLKDRCTGAEDDHILDSFISDYLAASGLFMLNITASNAPYIEFVDYMAALWDYFKDNHFHSPYISTVIGQQEMSGDSSDRGSVPKHRGKAAHLADYVDNDGEFVAVF